MGVPDRWLNYNNLGLPIKGTRFIAFKVPLKEAICRNLDKRYRFTPDMLLSECVKLGMVIDLTFTKRYYNETTFTSRGIEYHKIMCPGRAVPTKPLVDQFFRIVDGFLQSNFDKESLIGVHCTHGLNRTGVFVCKYMIERLGFAPSEAIREFESARGNAMERKEYIDDILCTIQSPPLDPSNVPNLTNPKNSFDTNNEINRNWNMSSSREMACTKQSAPLVPPNVPKLNNPPNSFDTSNGRDRNRNWSQSSQIPYTRQSSPLVPSNVPKLINPQNSFDTSNGRKRNRDWSQSSQIPYTRQSSPLVTYKIPKLINPQNSFDTSNGRKINRDWSQSSQIPYTRQSSPLVTSNVPKLINPQNSFDTRYKRERNRNWSPSRQMSLDKYKRRREDHCTCNERRGCKIHYKPQ